MSDINNYLKLIEKISRDYSKSFLEVKEDILQKESELFSNRHDDAKALESDTFFIASIGQVIQQYSSEKNKESTLFDSTNNLKNKVQETYQKENSNFLYKGAQLNKKRDEIDMNKYSKLIEKISRDYSKPFLEVKEDILQKESELFSNRHDDAKALEFDTFFIASIGKVIQKYSFEKNK